MSDSVQNRGAARALEPLEGPFLEFDLIGQIDQLRHEEYWQSGHNSKTIVKYPDFRMVLTAIQKGSRISEHQTAGRISIQTVRGHIRAHAEGREVSLPQDHLLVLDRQVPYDIEAVEDSAFLLMLAWPAET